MSVVRHVAAPVLAVALTASLIASASGAGAGPAHPAGAAGRTQGAAPKPAPRKPAPTRRRLRRGAAPPAAPQRPRRLRPGASSTWPTARSSAAST